MNRGAAPAPPGVLTPSERPAGPARDLALPGGQPGWARLMLLVITAVSALSYAWRADKPVNIEIYYAAAVRSMSMNLHNFIFAAFDPAGTVDHGQAAGRLLGAGRLGPAVRGACLGACAAPGHRGRAHRPGALSRGAAAGGAGGWLLAAGILAVSPATVALNRGNVSDTLMILLAVLAADATVTAMVTGRRRPILLAGLWIGLAFQAKMIEAWLVLPAIACGYLPRRGPAAGRSGSAAPGRWAWWPRPCR